ncbi:MAG: sialate O-acetylesterase [Sedimentisphaeraceae bacterium JB056]
MKIRLVFALICVLCGMSVLSCYGRDLESDTWVAADALGRELPGYDECGTIRDDKTVGVFYFLWHDRAVNVRDVTKLLAENPFAPDWGSRWSWHTWGEPEMGYYRITDPYVLRRHASMLSDAGVDMVFFDVGNGVVYTEEYMNLCSVWQQMRDEGENTPQICFQVFTNPSLTVQRIYDELYGQNLYPDLWFHWKGKPLILAPLVPSDSSYSSEVLDFFTMRYSWAWTSGEDTWSWLDHYPQNWGWETDPLIPEQTSVCIAQHPAGSSIGRSFLASETRGAGVKPPLDDYRLSGTEDLGIYFEQQWQRALSIDPEILFITGWNEWIAQRFIAGLDGSPIFLGEQTADGDTYFVDQFNQEFSRDAEPMKGGHTDNYYYQMIEGIRKYKGVSQLVNNDQAVNVTIDGNFSEWESVESVYYDTYGDTIHRNHLGLNSITYTNTTGRNDIIESKVAFDAYNLYLYSKTAEKLTSNTDSNWMLLFINSDQDAATGWEGYDYVINRNRRDTLTSLEKFMGNDWAPEPVGLISYSYSGNEIEIEIPRNLIDQDNKSNIAFDFHWADNIQTQGDIVEFSVSGDSAPNRRFNYRYQKSEPATHFNEDGEYEGWSLTNNLTNGSVSDGVLSCDIVGGDSYMINWTPFNVPASVYRYIHIRMKNQTSGGAAQVYWTTTTDTLMNNNKHKDFSIVAGDDEFTDYWLDMSSNEYWTGTIKFLRIDPSAATSGHIDIDFVRLQDSKPSCGDYGHDMSDMNRDCSVDLLDMAKLAEGWLRDVEVREELDVYVFAGQSNMYGLGLVSDLSSEYNTSFSQALIWFDGSWNVLSPDAGPYNGTRFGPEISFAHEMANSNPNRKFAIIKYAVGATNLYEQWNAPNGELYIELQNQVDAAINNLSGHYSPQIVGFMWMQGESDSHVLSTAQAYSQNLTNFITTLRSDFNLPDMPFYMGQISDCSYWTYYQTVNAGMVSVASAIANTGTFSTLDLTRWSSDPAHYDSAGQLELGRRFFNISQEP